MKSRKLLTLQTRLKKYMTEQCRHCLVPNDSTLESMHKNLNLDVSYLPTIHYSNSMRNANNEERDDEDGGNLSIGLDTLSLDTEDFEDLEATFAETEGDNQLLSDLQSNDDTVEQMLHSVIAESQGRASMYVDIVDESTARGTERTRNVVGTSTSSSNGMDQVLPVSSFCPILPAGVRDGETVHSDPPVPKKVKKDRTSGR